jgi:hypothetical protein
VLRAGRMIGVDDDAAALVKASRVLLRRMRAGDVIATQVQLVHMDREHLLLPAMRSWLLILSELGAARLPGGELAEPDNAGGLIRTDLDGTEVPWQLDLRESLIAAVRRDGDALYPIMTRAATGPHVLPYVSALAASAQRIVDALHLPAEVVNAAHLIGRNTNTAGHWSVAGLGLRHVVVTLATVDMGQQFASDMIGPEIDAIGKLSANDQSRLLAVMGAAFASVIASVDGDDGHELVSHPASAGTRDGWQLQAAQIALRVAVAYRSDLAGVVKLAESLTAVDVALGCYGAGNMLAVRCRELWGR